jgi:small-conductance mechanosensitive channel
MFLFALPLQDDLTFADIKQDWRHDFLGFIRNDLPRLAFILAYAFILLRIVLFFVNRIRRIADHQAAANPQRASELRTVAAILRASAYGIIGFIVLLHVLSVFHVNLTPLLASAGVAGIGLALAAQSLFKDVLNGIFILVENQYNVGDTVKIASLTGTVEDLTLRTTRLRDGDGTLYIVPNSQVATVSNLSRDFAVGTLNISVDAREDPDRVMSVLKALAVQVRKDEAFKDIVISDPNILGVDKISGYEVVYPINVRVMVNQRDGVMRELRRRVLLAFNKEKIAFGSSNSTMIVQSPAPDSASGTQPEAPAPASASAASPNATT